MEFASGKADVVKGGSKKIAHTSPIHVRKQGMMRVGWKSLASKPFAGIELFGGESVMATNSIRLH